MVVTPTLASMGTSSGAREKGGKNRPIIWRGLLCGVLVCAENYRKKANCKRGNETMATEKAARGTEKCM